MLAGLIWALGEGMGPDNPHSSFLLSCTKKNQDKAHHPIPLHVEKLSKSTKVGFLDAEGNYTETKHQIHK